MPRLIRDDGARLEYEVRQATGESIGTFVFLHGMGGDRHQSLGYLAGPLANVDLVCMDARGHGDSSDVVDAARCRFDAYADDVVALIDKLGRESVWLGGISLGAAVALNTAIRHPDRVSALVLCRPAWLETAQVDRNAGAYALIADLLDTQETDDALAELIASPIHAGAEAESPTAAQSLQHQVTRPRAAANAELIRRFPTHSPAPEAVAWPAIAVPTLVIGHTDDPFHPWPIAEATAARISGAKLVHVPSKDRDSRRFGEEIDLASRSFLDRLTWS